MIIQRCCSCDEIRDVERAFCHSCGEATNSYAHELTEREEYALSQVEAEDLFFTRAIPHVVHGLAFVDRAA